MQSRKEFYLSCAVSLEQCYLTNLLAGGLGCGDNFVEARITAQIIPARIQEEIAVSRHSLSGNRCDDFKLFERAVALAGHEYGTGSSRDWAAKGTRLLGVKAMIAASFERIHRSNLVEMGVLPLQFLEGTSPQSLGLDGLEKFSITGLSNAIKPGQQVTLEIESKNGEKRSVPVKLRIDTPIEIEYCRHGGILPFVLRQLLSK